MSNRSRRRALAGALIIRDDVDDWPVKQKSHASRLSVYRRRRRLPRYDCQVSTDATLTACDAVAGRLEGSVPPARMAELGNRM